MKTVIEMAREATNGRVAKNDAETESLIGLDEVTRFAELVRADERNRTWTQDHWTEYERSIAAVEREACAMLAWSAVLTMTDSDTADKVLAAIRARKTND